VLGLLVVVVKRRSDLEIVLAKRAGVATADIAGAEIVQSLKARTSCDRVQHIAGSLHVDPNRELALYRQVVHGSEMPDLGHVSQTALVEPKPRLGDVSFHQVHTTGQRSIGGSELLHASTRQASVLRLHEADRLAVGTAQDPRQQRAGQKPRKPRHQHRHMVTSSANTRKSRWLQFTTTTRFSPNSLWIAPWDGGSARVLRVPFCRTEAPLEANRFAGAHPRHEVGLVKARESALERVRKRWP